jgi:hypothetical protein
MSSLVSYCDDQSIQQQVERIVRACWLFVCHECEREGLSRSSQRASSCCEASPPTRRPKYAPSYTGTGTISSHVAWMYRSPLNNMLGLAPWLCILVALTGPLRGQHAGWSWSFGTSGVLHSIMIDKETECVTQPGSSFVSQKCIQPRVIPHA